jgi:hypothetical protein
MHRKAEQIRAPQGSAEHRKAAQSNAEWATSLFRGARTSTAAQCKAVQGKAGRGTAAQSNATQSNAVCPQRHTGSLWTHHQAATAPACLNLSRRDEMTMLTLTAVFTGVAPLLQANPQGVARSNAISQRIKQINAKKTKRTDADYAELADLEVASRVYFDDDIGVYVPTRWVAEAVARKAFSVAKISKQDTRGALFMVSDRAPLTYRNRDRVKVAKDIVKDPYFRHAMILPQGKVRIEKNSPIFHDWSFSTAMEFDDKVFDRGDLQRIITDTAHYVGFGDFRPTFGRARVEFAK